MVEQDTGHRCRNSPGSETPPPESLGGGWGTQDTGQWVEGAPISVPAEEEQAGQPGGWAEKEVPLLRRIRLLTKNDTEDSLMTVLEQPVFEMALAATGGHMPSNTYLCSLQEAQIDNKAHIQTQSR